MRAYYATKLSPNMSRTPNGFLICKNVPIARIGEQEYLGSEIGMTDREDEVISVLREENEVFSPETLASFEGAIFCDEHPPTDVTTQNVQHLQRGFVKDVRRGADEDADKILADIIVTDPITIAAIEDGKREISCGYKCDYAEREDGTICQCNIRGNHVALVDSGRAGKDVAIKDSAPQKPTTRKENYKMAKKTVSGKPQGLLAKFLGIVTTDADPEVVSEIVEELVGASDSDEPEKKEEVKDEGAEGTPKPEAKAEDEHGDEPPLWAKAILERLDRIEAAQSPKDEDALEALEKEVTAEGEEAVTKPVEEMDEGETADEETEDEGAALDEDTTDEGGEEKETPKSEASDKALRKAIRDAKAVVAGIKDPKARKTVSDSMAKLIRSSYGVKSSTPKGAYAAINSVKSRQATNARDAASGGKTVSIEARQKAYDARNPHIKKA